MIDYNTETKVKESRNEDILELADKYRWEVGDNLHDSILEAVYKDAEEIAAKACLLYTSPSPRDRTRSRMPSSA
jgi:hypothetical protein